MTKPLFIGKENGERYIKTIEKSTIRNITQTHSPESNLFL